MDGLEPSTSRLSGERSNQLSYIPIRLNNTIVAKSAFVVSVCALGLLRFDVRSLKRGYGVWHLRACARGAVIRRKEVIQPHLPVQLPCYDFVPVTSPAFGGCLLAVGPPTSGVTSSHDVTGGVYKARERIQRSIADLRLLATPASCRRVAAYNPN